MGLEADVKSVFVDRFSTLANNRTKFVVVEVNQELHLRAGLAKEVMHFELLKSILESNHVSYGMIQKGEDLKIPAPAGEGYALRCAGTIALSEKEGVKQAIFSGASVHYDLGVVGMYIVPIKELLPDWEVAF